MLNIIKNAFRDKKYYICLYENYIYVYNYISILNFKDNFIILKLENNNIKINGDNLKIKKLEINELLVEGNIYGVSYE